MSSDQQSPLGAADLDRSARWLAQALDPATRQVRLVEMDPEAYRAASFLDDRMFTRPTEAKIIPWDSLAGAVPPDARTDARWIFHIGHVGSTLVARLLGEIGGVLALREPRLLRDLTFVPPAERGRMARVATALMSRTFAAGETAVVKATSFVSDIAPELVPPGERALFMFATPANYVASILAGENSLRELAAMANSRSQRMAGRVTGLQAQGRSAAHQAAAAWACEMTSLEAAAEAMPARSIEWADFDAMLSDIGPALERAVGFFGFSTHGAELQAIAGGPLIGRYSKAVEHEYSPDLRRDLIAEATAANGSDIDDALAMLARAAEKSPLLARALARASEG
jgi:hypothetical protein